MTSPTPFSRGHAFAKEHPEYDVVIDRRNYPWAEKKPYYSRVITAEIMWVLQLDGPITKSPNGVLELRKRLEKRGSIVVGGLTQLALAVILTDMATGANNAPLAIAREINGRRTRGMALLPGVELPPNPFAAAEKANAARAAAKAEADRKGRELRSQLEEQERANQETKERLAAEALARAEEVERQQQAEAAKVRDLLDMEPSVTAEGVVSLVPVPALPEPPPDTPTGSRSLDEFIERAENADNPLDKLLLIQSVLSDATLDVARIASQAMSYRHAAEQRPAEDDKTAERLAEALAENQRLRRKLADATETAVAHKRDAAAVRKAMAALQANFDALLGQARIDDSGFRALRSMMAEKPRVPVG